MKHDLFRLQTFNSHSCCCSLRSLACSKVAKTIALVLLSSPHLEDLSPAPHGSTAAAGAYLAEYISVKVEEEEERDVAASVPYSNGVGSGKKRRLQLEMPWNFQICTLGHLNAVYMIGSIVVLLGSRILKVCE